MKEKLIKIENSRTSELLPRPKRENVIVTKWVFKNKLNENGKVVRNKSQLLCKGYVHVEGEQFKETFDPLARMESIRLFLAYSCFKIFKVY